MLTPRYAACVFFGTSPFFTTLASAQSVFAAELTVRAESDDRRNALGTLSRFADLIFSDSNNDIPDPPAQPDFDEKVMDNNPPSTYFLSETRQIQGGGRCFTNQLTPVPHHGRGATVARPYRTSPGAVF